MTTIPSGANIRLEDLIALNDEIAALVRAGVPLERGLGELGRDMPGRLGRFATELAERTARGESLSTALAETGSGLPKVYRAVVEAGILSGRLPSALESLAGSMRRLAETRRVVIASMIYPWLVLMMAWGLLALVTADVAPRLHQSFQELGVHGANAFLPLVRIGQQAEIWGPVGLAILVVLALIAWFGSARASLFGGWTAWSGDWFPWMYRISRDSRIATFVEILSLLIENQMPLDRAILLAGDASGDRRVAEAAAGTAESIRQGHAALLVDHHSRQRHSDQLLPPLLTWSIAGNPNQEALLSALRHAAETYRRRAQHRAEMVRVFMPLLFTLGIGGTIVLSYALIFLAPYAIMLKSLAKG